MCWKHPGFGESGTGNCQGISGCQLDFLFVDNAAMQIILNPKQFDVILTENMFGDILSVMKPV